jgi:hypothetical protein
VALAGTGTANVRLVPGKYEITASNDGTRVTGQATVSVGRHTTLKLPAHQKSLIPSPDDINFTGMETVIANGITTDQAASTRWLFFKYWQNAQNIRISPSTVAPGPRHPDSNDPFILTFSGLIDDTPYNAKLTYTDLVNVELTLTNPQTGVVLFDQATTKSTD